MALASRAPALATYSDHLGKVLGRRSYHSDHLWGFWLFNDPGLERLRGGGLGAFDGGLPRAARLPTCTGTSVSSSCRPPRRGARRMPCGEGHRKAVYGRTVCTV